MDKCSDCNMPVTEAAIDFCRKNEYPTYCHPCQQVRGLHRYTVFTNEVQSNILKISELPEFKEFFKLLEKKEVSNKEIILNRITFIVEQITKKGHYILLSVLYKNLNDSYSCDLLTKEQYEYYISIYHKYKDKVK